MSPATSSQTRIAEEQGEGVGKGETGDKPVPTGVTRHALMYIKRFKRFRPLVSVDTMPVEVVLGEGGIREVGEGVRD